MPEFDGVEDFPSPSDDLAEIPSAVSNGFIFVSLAPIENFDAFVEETVMEPLGTGQITFDSSRTYEVNANWALYCENYLEGFHIPFVHQSLNEVVDYGSYTTKTLRYSSVQTGYGKQGEIAARYLFIFPNTMFNFYPWGVSVNVVRPVASDKTAVDFITYISNKDLIAEGAGNDLHGVEMEDEAVVESVQRGIRSRFYTRGRYSPTREQGTHHFHRLIAEFLNR